MWRALALCVMLCVMVRRSGAAAVAIETGSGVFKRWSAPGGASAPLRRRYSLNMHIEAEEKAKASVEREKEEDSLVRLARTYKSRFVRCSLGSADARVDVLLCGTLHVTTSSQDFVKDVVATTRPGMVVLEICEARIDSICPPDVDEERMNVTLSAVLTASVKGHSLKTFGMGVLTWIQCRAAAFMGNNLGGELAVAAKEAHSVGATVVLGDRLYGVTVQRAFDRLSRFERVKMVTILTWEVLTMSFFKLSDYIKKSEQDEDFIRREIERFGKYLPSFADVLINERDEYLAQSLLELSRLMQTQPPGCVRPPVTVVAVVGAGHLPGIQKWLACGGVSEERIAEISSSSKHTTSTWPGKGRLRIVDTDMIFDVPVPEAGMALPQQTPHAQQQQQPPPPPPLFSQPQAQSQS